MPTLLQWRKLRLLLMARLYRGHVRLGRNVQLNHPVVFQGRGTLVIEDDVMLGFGLAGAISRPILLQPREPQAVIALERGCAVMNGSELIARQSIRVCRHVMIGPEVFIMDSDFHSLAADQRQDPGKSAPVVIGENAWIGARAIVLKGVKIGAHAVVAAGAVVPKDVEGSAVVAGNPARVVGKAAIGAGIEL